MSDTVELALKAMAELATTFVGMDSDSVEILATEILDARRIVCHGLGREGLMIRAFCMRLMHLGTDAHVAGDVTTPPIGPGDLLLTSSGPGDLLMVRSIIQRAHEVGARVIVLTAQPDGPDPAAADLSIVIPAQTMANDVAIEHLLPMGTAYEIALLIVLDLVAIRIRERSGQSPQDLRARHYNLE